MRRRFAKENAGTCTTTQSVADMLSTFLNRIQRARKDKPEEIIAAWPQLIGEKYAPMTQAIGFSSGVLRVIVKNSTLYSLLVQNEKPRLIRILRKQFPHADIRDIAFRIG